MNRPSMTPKCDELDAKGGGFEAFRKLARELELDRDLAVKSGQDARQELRLAKQFLEVAHAQLGMAIPAPEVVMSIVNLLLEDVAEKPSRLPRAMEIAVRDIRPLLVPIGSLHAPLEALAPEVDPKAVRRCTCEFSGGGVWAKKCLFHESVCAR
jgi:hypothetical protein